MAWDPVELDLSSVAGREVELVFRTEGDTKTRWFVGAPVVAGKWSGRNLLMYLIDTMRADVLEPYGYAGRTSPVLSRLAREGMLFEECISVSSWTRPAAASLLTSRSAPAHGVVQETSSLASDVPTWAEMLREQGYYTVAFFTNPNAGRSSRLDRGFDLTFETQHLVEFANRPESEARWGGRRAARARPSRGGSPTGSAPWRTCRCFCTCTRTIRTLRSIRALRSTRCPRWSNSTITS